MMQKLVFSLPTGWVITLLFTAIPGKKSPPNYFCFLAKTVLVVFAFSWFLRWHEVTSEGQREKTESLALVPIEGFLICASTLNDANCGKHRQRPD